jgi:hypothetical protein
MKTLALAMLVLLSTTSSRADGFKCEGVNTGVMIQVYNHTQPELGTRVPAVMVVSDSMVRSPNKTIAIFNSENETLSYLGNGLFQGKVDLRYTETSHKGENIAGTKLGYLSHIQLQLLSHFGKKFDYSRADDFKNNEILDARISYLKRNGEVLEEKALCKRYLKN